MAVKSRYLARLVLFLGVVAFIMGLIFIAQGIAKSNLLTEAMRVEQVTYLLPEEEVAKGNIIDTSEEAEMVADTVREHRRNIALTYEALLGEGRYDPTNPEHLSYAQALNMENYLYLAVLGFGLTTVVITSGVFMAITGIALGGVGVLLLRITRE